MSTEDRFDYENACLMIEECIHQHIALLKGKILSIKCKELHISEQAEIINVLHFDYIKENPKVEIRLRRISDGKSCRTIIPKAAFDELLCFREAYITRLSSPSCDIEYKIISKGE